MSGEPPLIALPDQSTPLLEATRTVLTTPHLPPVVLIGGLAVTMRVGVAGALHRATVDIDLVTTAAEPEAFEVLASAHDSQRQPLVIGDVRVDLIATSPVTEEDLDGFADSDRLFVAGHRWAFEGGTPARLTTATSEPLDVPVATAAGLVATKCHAIGFPTSRRRATKHAADLFDLFRLVELYNAEGDLSRELRSSPAGLARIVANIAHREIVANAAAATRMMASVAPAPIYEDHVDDVVETFVDELRV